MRENLQVHLKRLTQTERAVLCAVLKHKLEWADTHQGMLPFLSREDVVQWLNAWVCGGLNSNALSIHRRILSKLKPIRTGCALELKDGKVFRRFGKHPERGISIPGLPNVNRYRKPKAFERKADAYEVQTQIVSLKHIGLNRWMLMCGEDINKQVVAWLENNLR